MMVISSNSQVTASPEKNLCQ